MAQIIVALDVPSFKEAQNLITTLDDTIEYYKVGSQLFTAVGPAIIDFLKSFGKKVFLDLKYHDIPNTVANSVAVAANLGVDIVDLHTLGGFEMMEAAVKALWGLEQEERPKLIGVTVLTSLNEADLSAIFGKSNGDMDEEITKLATLAKDAGLDGVVASPNEIRIIKESCDEDFLVITPGIRPEKYSISDDQKRSMTPKEAADAGADFLVIGRPIIKAEDPPQAAEEIKNSIS
jgi:orotidine-5'-phosphate decarboxylase